MKRSRPCFWFSVSISANLLATALLPSRADAQTQPPVNAGTLLEQQRNNPPGLPDKAMPALPEPPASPAQPPSAVADDGTRVALRGFAFVGNQRLDSGVLQAALAPWLGRSVGLAELRQATVEIERLYRSQGWLARANLPPQDVSEGIVRIDVTEVRMGRVAVRTDGPTAPAPTLQARAQALLQQSLPTGQPLSTAALERATAIADDLPGLHASSSLQAGTEPGTADVLLQLRPDKPWRIDTTLDNGGIRATGSERAYAALTLNAPFGWGEQFKLDVGESRGSDYLRVAASAPLVWPGQAAWSGWRVGVDASALRYKVLDKYNTTTGLPPKGSGQTAGVSLTYPLVASPLSRWQLVLGYEARRLANNDDNLTVGLRERTSQARIDGASVGVQGSHIDRLGGGGANYASLVYSQSRLRLDGSPAQYLADDALNADTQGHFGKLRWSASRVQVLPDQWSLLLQGSGQWASRNLDASERFYLGGINGVRAYPTSEGSGSSGQLLSLALRRNLQWLGSQWQLSAFYDWGQVQQFVDNQRPGGGALSGRNRITLAGHGLSLEWRGENNGLSARLTWAARDGHNPLATPNGKDTDGSHVRNRFWLSTTLSF